LTVEQSTAECLRYRVNRNPDGRRALGAVLRSFRKARGLSQQALGFAADVDRTYVGAVERGEQNLSFEGLWQLIHALEVSWEGLGRALDQQSALRRRPRSRSDARRAESVVRESDGAAQPSLRRRRRS
jgi:transcriptional regulator with XRE-family HTH domain